MHFLPNRVMNSLIVILNRDQNINFKIWLVQSFIFKHVHWYSSLSQRLIWNQWVLDLTIEMNCWLFVVFWSLKFLWNCLSEISFARELNRSMEHLREMWRETPQCLQMNLQTTSWSGRQLQKCLQLKNHNSTGRMLSCCQDKSPQQFDRNKQTNSHFIVLKDVFMNHSHYYLIFWWLDTSSDSLCSTRQTQSHSFSSFQWWNDSILEASQT